MPKQRAFSINLGPSFTGLALAAQPILPSGAAAGPPITDGFVEIGSGNYLWTTTALANDFVGGIRFSTTAGVLVAFIDVNAAPATVVDVLTGGGSVQTDHNYGGPDALSYKTAAGVGIDNAIIRVYLKSDYDAGNTATQYRKAETLTDANGRWTKAVFLDPGTYTVVCFKQGAYGPDTIDLTVT